MALQHLSDDGLRRRIVANALVLFPSPSDDNNYEIVYAAYPRIPEKKTKAADPPPPWQYAILIRKDAIGDYQPLLKGTAWSTGVPWTHALPGLLDTSALAIHKKFASAALPEELPGYSPPTGESSSTPGGKGATYDAVERAT